MSADETEVMAAAKPPRRWRWLLATGLAMVALLLLAGGVLALLARMGRPFVVSSFNATPSIGVEDANPAQLDRLAAQAAKEIRQVEPKGTYIVVDTFRNRLRLIDDGKVLRSAICSTGTGTVLKDPRNGKEWVFDTPMGERIIQRKVTHPVWAKPDWAFIEDGYLPPKDSSERFDNESLGNYAMYIGDGYIIHGTLFQSLLGRSITHGCVRLGDKDLDFVYHHASVGTRVYLY